MKQINWKMQEISTEASLSKEAYITITKNMSSTSTVLRKKIKNGWKDLIQNFIISAFQAFLHSGVI